MLFWILWEAKERDCALCAGLRNFLRICKQHCLSQEIPDVLKPVNFTIREWSGNFCHGKTAVNNTVMGTTVKTFIVRIGALNHYLYTMNAIVNSPTSTIVTTTPMSTIWGELASAIPTNRHVNCSSIGWATNKSRFQIYSHEYGPIKCEWNLDEY